MKKEALEFIQTHSLIGIKAGKDRDSFLEIWMVVVDGRIFARSWSLSERSWYTTFLNDSQGQIQCWEAIYPIKAMIPNDLERISEKINQAYLAKYNSGENAKYAQGIVQKNTWTKPWSLLS